MRPYLEKPETQYWRLEPTGVGNPAETCRLTGTGTAPARQEAAGQDFGWVWDPRAVCLLSKPGLLAGYVDPLLTLHSTTCPGPA